VLLNTPPGAKPVTEVEELKAICAELREQNRLLRDLLGEMTALREVAERTHAVQEGAAAKPGGNQSHFAGGSPSFFGFRPRFDNTPLEDLEELVENYLPSKWR
jgi:hypothetical protein